MKWYELWAETIQPIEMRRSDQNKKDNEIKLSSQLQDSL